MIADLLKEILSDYRDGISLEKMDTILCGSSLQSKILESLNNSDVGHLDGGVSYRKETLTREKEMIFVEFDDFLRDKIHNGKIRQDIINNFRQKIPDSVMIQWLDAPADRQIYVFDLLMTMIIKPKQFADPLKKTFSRVVDLYTSMIVYISLLFKNYEEDADVVLGIIEDVESIESRLSEHFFRLLTVPEQERCHLGDINDEVEALDASLSHCIDKYFSQLFQNSKHLFRRVFDRELSGFDMTVILTRYNFANLNDWIIFLTDTDTMPDRHTRNLFADLGLN